MQNRQLIPRHTFIYARTFDHILYLMITTILIFLIGVASVFASGFLHLFLLPLRYIWYLIIALCAGNIFVWGSLIATASRRIINKYIGATRQRLDRGSSIYVPLALRLDNGETNTPLTGIALEAFYLTDLIQQYSGHVVLLGTHGSGKTLVLRTYQHMQCERWKSGRGSGKIPLYVSLKEYNARLEKEQESVEEGTPAYYTSLVDYICTATLDGMRTLSPYLREFFQRGHIVLLCDDLHAVNTAFLHQLCQELVNLMSGDNTVFVSCDETFYQEQPVLEMLIGEDYAQRVVLSPLANDQLVQFINRYYDVDAANQTTWPCTVHEIVHMIENFHLRENATNPSFLYTLIATIRSMDREQLERIKTRGLLLQAMVNFLLATGDLENESDETAIAKSDVRELLCSIAGMMRIKQQEDGLEPDDVALLENDVRQRKSYLELAGKLEKDETDLSSDALFEEDDPALPTIFSLQQIAALLKFAENTAFISISPRNLLHFSYPAFAEYFAAEYLQRLEETTGQERLPIERELLTNESHWRGAIRTWSGLVDDPVQLENRIAYAGRSDIEHAANALVLGILCVDMRASQKAQRSLQDYTFPKALEELFKQILASGTGVETLRNVFMRCGQEVGTQVYRFLLPYITFEKVDELFCALDKQEVSSLLFAYLPQAIRKNEYGVMPLIISILGKLGGVVITEAEKVSAFRGKETGNLYNERLTLRKTAIAILGRVHDDRAVNVLLRYLREGSEISQAASEALIGSGSTLALQPILDEAIHPHTAMSQKLALWVIHEFLSPPPADQVQYQNILDTLLNLLSSEYGHEVHRQAQWLLIQEMQANEERSKAAIKTAIYKLSLPEIDTSQMRNIQVVLQRAGTKATKLLLDSLQQSSEVAMIRIIEVIAIVRDKLALLALLALLVKPSQGVRELVAKTLVSYAPESVAPLVQLILSVHSSDAEAQAAFSILKDIGDGSTEYIVQHLQPIVPKRTQLLVQVLGYVQNGQAVPALLALLRLARQETDNMLIQDIVDALGRMPDRRSVDSLLETLTYADMQVALQPLYTHVYKVLSLFVTEGLEELVASLDSEQETSVTNGVRQALLLMQPFPQQQLLNTFASGSTAQVKQVISVFGGKGANVAHFLVGNLCHVDERTRQYVQQTLDQMEENELLQALLDLHHLGCRSKIAFYLHKYAQVSIPRLVEFLASDDALRSDAAFRTLTEFGPTVLSALPAGLRQQKIAARQRSQDIIVGLVQKNAKILPDVFELFRLLADVNGHSGRSALLDVLTNELAETSIPALVRGLSSPDLYIRTGIVEALVLLVKKNNKHSEVVLNRTHGAFLKDEQREGAASVLARSGAKAVPYVERLATHTTRDNRDNEAIRQAACVVLSEIGAPALPTVLKFIKTPLLRGMGESILRDMKTLDILDYLIELLGSQKLEEVENALTLLLGRVHTDLDIALRPLDKRQEIVPALLEHVKSQPRRVVHLRIMAFLLLLDKKIVLPALKQIVEKPPYSQSWVEWLAPLFLMLNMGGNEARDVLFGFIQNTSLPSLPRKVSNELVGVLGMIEDNEIVEKYAVSLVNRPKFVASANVVQTTDQTELALHALGGLLMGGKWNSNKIQDLRRNAANETNEHEFYTTLLGDSYVPRIKELNRLLEEEKNARRREVATYKAELQLSQESAQKWRTYAGQQKEERDDVERELRSTKEQLKREIANKTRLAESNRTLSEANQRLNKASQKNNDFWS